MPRREMPTKAAVDKLIRLYALKIYSADAAPLSIAQRFHDQFQKHWSKLRDEFPTVDVQSDMFWSHLHSAATEWWKSRAFRGPGSDW